MLLTRPVWRMCRLVLISWLSLSPETKAPTGFLYTGLAEF
jgi:hypothetical protein